MKSLKRQKNKKHQSLNASTSKREKIASIRENKNTEKQLNRQQEKFDLSPATVSEKAEVIDFSTKKRYKVSYLKV